MTACLLCAARLPRSSMSWTTRSPCAAKDGFDATQKEVLTDRGKTAMDEIRAEIDAMVRAELRGPGSATSTTCSWPTKGPSPRQSCTSALGFLLAAIVAYLLRQAANSRARQEWIQTGQIQLSQLISGQPAIGANGGQPAAVPLPIPGRHGGRLLCQRRVVVSARGDLWRAERCAFHRSTSRPATVCWARRSRKNERSLSTTSPRDTSRSVRPWAVQIRGICS